MELIKRFTLLLLVLFPLVGMAQGKFTDKLRRQSSSGSTVILVQDSVIENLVNGVKPTAPEDTLRQSAESGTERVQKTSGAFNRVNGYRVQIMMAGNTAKDKEAVKAIGRKFKSRFPDVNVYVSFHAPHWVCTVGDYYTREEASAMLHQLRATGQFNSSSIIRSKINNYY